MAKTLYQVLEVDNTASAAEIKSAYRRLARLHHPDRIQAPQEKKSATARFREIESAYQVLKDPRKRAAYDRKGGGADPKPRAASTGGPRPPASWAAQRTKVAAEAVTAVLVREGEELARDLGRTAVNKGVDYIFGRLFGGGGGGK